MKNKYIINYIKQIGLSKEDYQECKSLLRRDPLKTELALFSAMWSEHCSYKSSKYWLKKLPHQANYVIQGPGENAGVIDIGSNNAIVFKIESHNHPSFIEPYQGAATGVGGIMRDIFTMGARPIANLNCLRFGSLENKKTKYLFNGVVSGVGDYGNCTGIPTVAGECSFDSRYNENILVNAMTVGITKKNKIFYAKAGKPGNKVVYVGSKTGRDGIHGASMSSEAFSEKSESLKPTVQVGDPFSEKLLMEACLELMNYNSIIGLQDMGAAGLTSSAVEIAAASKLGIKLNLDRVPLRDGKMSADEIMLSESQERMLMIIKPEKLNIAKKIFEKWGLSFSSIGEITNNPNIKISFKKKVVADIPLEFLTSAKTYRRPFIINRNIYTNKAYPKKTIADIVKKIFNDSNLSYRELIWEQYDHMITRDVISKMGGNASIIKTNDKYQAIATTTDCNIFYCDTDPYLGVIQAISESFRNLVSVGARPLAITNCLNFGNPEKKEIMGQFVQTIKGMKIASKKLSLPIVSGNVSFYNETNNRSIPPTPQIGAVGVINDYRKTKSLSSFYNNDFLYIIGETKGHLSSSAYERCFFDFSKTKSTSMPPVTDLDLEVKMSKVILYLIKKSLITACHDVSDGGILISVLEMCLAKKIGLNFSNLSSNHKYLFGEDQSRYLVAINKSKIKEVCKILNKNDIKHKKLGIFSNKHPILLFPDKSSIKLNDLSFSRKIWEKKV
ncbi:MAG: Phosphoribosylformylglycinamidine synthase subunit PurL [Alphaproteobacteria bacterium MarineAlpha9_Bin4]|nr:phosphoribosylformylglycinamidine synthase II [Pelagibacterales bacterium]PPR27004.1 MAG: Phosphoribosylformylglycinamidine synthase subunit PurL [Alphaproteobacteria bacterium MarineAlpha9_Bin4]